MKSYSDSSIKVLSGFDLAKHMFKLGDYQTIFTTQAIYGVLQAIERCSNFYQKSRKRIKTDSTVESISNELIDEIEELYEDCWSIGNPNLGYHKWYLTVTDKKYEIDEMMENNMKIVKNKINGLEKARNNFWNLYNDISLGYSTDERSYSQSYSESSYKASYVSELAKGELDREEIKDSDDERIFSLDSLEVTSSEELTEEEQQEYEQEEEERQIEQSKQLEEEERKERELIFDDEVDLEAQDSVKEIQTLREEFLKTEEEDKRQEILSKAQELADEYLDKLVEEDEEENEKYWRENPEEDEEE